MGAILACTICRNMSLEMPKSTGLTFSVGGQSREFLPLYCSQCSCLLWIDKEAIEQDGEIWRYKPK